MAFVALTFVPMTLRIALEAAPEMRLPMASPITRWMTAWARATGRLADQVNGTTTAAVVARPTIHEK